MCEGVKVSNLSNLPWLYLVLLLLYFMTPVMVI